MIIAVDETGDFHEKGDIKYGLVTLVTITDSEWVKFSDFMNKLFPQGWGHIKGHNLGIEDRIKILRYIGKKQEIKYTTSLYDLTIGSNSWVENHQREEVKRMNNAIERARNANGHPSLIAELKLLRNKLGSLAVGDYAKFIMFFELYREWMKFFQFDFFYTYPKNDSWKMKHIVDTQNNPDKFKELLKNILMLTINELSPDYKVYSPEEWPSDHPFNKIYGIPDRPDGLDGRLFFSDFTIGDEHKDLPLFLPDVIGNTIHKSIKNRKNSFWLRLLKRLKSNRSLTLTNKESGSASRYYSVNGFNKSLNRKSVSPSIKEHYLLMKGV